MKNSMSFYGSSRWPVIGLGSALLVFGLFTAWAASAEAEPPPESSPRIASISVAGTNLVLAVIIPSGLAQVILESRPALHSPWSEQGALEVPPGGGQVVFTIPKPAGMQLFRLKARPQASGPALVSSELDYVPIAPMGSPAAAEAVFDFKGVIDGSDKIILTREGALWEHAHWDWPQGPVTVNGTQWDPRQKTYLTCAGAARFLPERFSLEQVKLEVITGRDVVALERAERSLIIYLDDTPLGVDEYHFRLRFPPAVPSRPPAGRSTAATLKLAAEIDGSDCVRITAKEATWEHKAFNYPKRVNLNGTAWDLQQGCVLPNAGTNQFLPAGIDFSSARIVSRRGRDLATCWAEPEAVTVRFADNPNGSDAYELEIGFGP